MEKLLLLVSLTFIGCASVPETQKLDLNKPDMARANGYAKKFSSGYVGCDPKKITVKNFEAEFYQYETLQTWQAICENETYYCSFISGLRVFGVGVGAYQHAHCAKSKS